MERLILFKLIQKQDHNPRQNIVPSENQPPCRITKATIITFYYRGLHGFAFFNTNLII